MRKTPLYFSIILFSIFYFLFSPPASAATNISPDSPPQYLRWAWNDIIGWIDFYPPPPENANINVIDNQANSRLEGYAVSNVGYIAFDCATSPAFFDEVPGNEPACDTALNNWKVKMDADDGTLSGWAWNDAIGWISFNCKDLGECGINVPVYDVTVDLVRCVGETGCGDFHGWAWNDKVGWISFNCSDPEINDCNPNFRVNTALRILGDQAKITSSIFDTGGLSSLNSVMWRGLTQGVPVKVLLQIASSNDPNGPGGDWGDNDYNGADAGCSSGTFMDLPVNTPVKPSNLYCHDNKRYFRYKAILETNPAKTKTPIVEDIILNWSP